MKHIKYMFLYANPSKRTEGFLLRIVEEKKHNFHYVIK